MSLSSNFHEIPMNWNIMIPRDGLIVMSMYLFPSINVCVCNYPSLKIIDKELDQITITSNLIQLSPVNILCFLINYQECCILHLFSGITCCDLNYL